MMRQHLKHVLFLPEPGGRLIGQSTDVASIRKYWHETQLPA